MKTFDKSPKFIIFLLVLTFFISAPCIYAKESEIFKRQINFAEKFWRTELYFGMNKPDDSEVSAAEWSDFLENEVTPRFPDGFTVLESFGQYKDNRGKIIKEKSRVVILLYTKKDKRKNNTKIEEIRTAYKKFFQQESVLRMDFRQSLKVSF